MKYDDRRGSDRRGFRDNAGHRGSNGDASGANNRPQGDPPRDARPQNPPRPARKTYNIPPATRVDGNSPARTLPVRPGKNNPARTLPVRPGEDSPARTLPVRPGKNSPARTLPVRPGENNPSRTLPVRPGEDSPARTLPVRPGGNNPARALPVRPGDARAGWKQQPRSNRPPRGESADARPPRDDRAPDGQYLPRPPRTGGFAEGGLPAIPRPPREFSAPEPPENLLAGRNPIREALKSGAPLEKLLVASGDLSGAARDIVRMARDAGVVVQTVERYRLDQIYPAHQGMLAFRSARAYATVEDILDYAREKGEAPLVVVLDQVTDPHNLGAIIRSAECAGAHGVVIPERRAAGLTPACEKAAAGALNHVRVARVKNLNRALRELKDAGLWVVAAALEGENALTADLSGPLALVIGSEGEGISRLTLELCDRRVTLPLRGQIGSLNASVAAGVLLYQVVRARGGDQ